MRNEEWIALFRSVPEHLQPQIVLQLANGSEICFDTIVHYDANYLVVRGRLGGTTDEGRGFFIPYDQMLMMRWERMVKLADLQELAGLERSASTSILEQDQERRDAEEAARVAGVSPPPASPDVGVAEPAAAGAGGAMNTKTILEKIRAMRAGNPPPAAPPSGSGPRPTGR